MSNPRIPRRTLKRLLILHKAGILNKTQIAQRLRISRSTLREHLQRYQEWLSNSPSNDEKDICAFLDQTFSPIRKTRPLTPRRIALINTFPQAPGLVNATTHMKAMWEQYRRQHPNGYGYTQYVEHYKAWQKTKPHAGHGLSKWAIDHIPQDDMRILKAWRRSDDRRKWERAVIIMDANKGRSITDLCSKVERSRRLIQRWIAGYRDHGLAGVPAKHTTTVSPEIKRLIKEKKDGLVEIMHQTPCLYGINRASWSLKTLAKAYEVEHGESISTSMISTYVKSMGYSFRKARRVLTSSDPDFRAKLQEITSILSSLGERDKFFSIDEYGPFAVRMQGGTSLVKRGETATVPQRQKSKGSLIVTAALELSTNQLTHFYSTKKNTDEMIKLLMMLLDQYAGEDRIYFSWDAASWHASKKLNGAVDQVNAAGYRKKHRTPLVQLAPLPCSAQFLNVIESVFSGMAKAIIHNSDYPSTEECKSAIDRYFKERNEHFRENPKRAGNKIWGHEIVKSEFSPRNNCKDPSWR